MNGSRDVYASFFRASRCYLVLLRVLLVSFVNIYWFVVAYVALVSLDVVTIINRSISPV